MDEEVEEVLEHVGQPLEVALSDPADAEVEEDIKQHSLPNTANFSDTIEPEPEVDEEIDAPRGDPSVRNETTYGGSNLHTEKINEGAVSIPEDDIYDQMNWDEEHDGASVQPGGENNSDLETTAIVKMESDRSFHPVGPDATNEHNDSEIGSSFLQDDRDIGDGHEIGEAVSTGVELVGVVGTDSPGNAFTLGSELGTVKSTAADEAVLTEEGRSSLPGHCKSPDPEEAAAPSDVDPGHTQTDADKVAARKPRARAVDTAEEGGQAKADMVQRERTEALKARAAKRLEEQAQRGKREAIKARKLAAQEEKARRDAGEVGDGLPERRSDSTEALLEGGDAAANPLKVYSGEGGHPTRLRKLVKDNHQSGDELGAGGRSGWDDSKAAPVQPSVKSRHEAVEQRKRERMEARQRRLEEEQHARSAGEGSVAVEDGSVALHPVDAKPSRSKSYNSNRRLRARSTAAGAAGEERGRVVLPPIVSAEQPRTSPDPARASLQGLFQDTGATGKPRRVRKPLYQRMIEKAQQQFIDEERQKHESYLEKRKLKQRSNPTAEELREHRRKHDELVHAKLEEGRRQLAEAAVANARAVKRQQAVASAVQEALEEGGAKAELVVDGASPLRKPRAKKAPPAERSGGKSVPQQSGASAEGGQVELEDHGFSPIKRAASPSRGDGDDVSMSDPQVAADLFTSTDQSVLDGGRGAASPGSSQHVPLQYDQRAAAAAVQRIPALSPQAIPTYCASDWIDVLATADHDGAHLHLSGMTVAGVKATSSSAQVLVLQPAPPNPDAQRLMTMTIHSFSGDLNST